MKPSPKTLWFVAIGILVLLMAGTLFMKPVFPLLGKHGASRGGSGTASKGGEQIEADAKQIKFDRPRDEESRIASRIESLLSIAPGEVCFVRLPARETGGIGDVAGMNVPCARTDMEIKEVSKSEIVPRLERILRGGGRLTGMVSERTLTKFTAEDLSMTLMGGHRHSRAVRGSFWTC